MSDQRSPQRRSYREAQLAARASAEALSVQQTQRVVAALQRYADRLAGAVGEHGLSRELALQAVRRLEGELVLAALEGRNVAYAEIAQIWEQASLATMRADGVTSASLISAVRDPTVTLLGAYERLEGAAGSWRTLVSGGAGQLAAAVDRVIADGLAAGMAPQDLARRLRPFVTGSETITAAFGDSPIDLRRLPAELRAAGRTLLHNTQRIAFTEVHNARAEAELTAFAADPYVSAVAWRLAPDRGSQVVPDECDVFAESDTYGLGPGVYPLDGVPLPPHPWDRCERVPITRGVEQLGQPKPSAGHGTQPAPFPGLTPPPAVAPAVDPVVAQLQASLVVPPTPAVPPPMTPETFNFSAGLRSKALRDHLDDVYVERLEGEARDAVVSYQDGAYARINGHLRGRRPLYGYELSRAETEIARLDDVLEESPRIGRDAVFYRGGHVPSQNVGDEFVDAGFGSVSANAGTARDFMDSSQHVFMRVGVPAQQRGVWTEGAIGDGSEAEFLLPRGTRYRVTQVRYLDGPQFRAEFGGLPPMSARTGTGTYRVTIVDVVIVP